MGGFRSVDVRQLLHNKFIVVLGDSIQRSVYKDLVKFLQKDEFLSKNDLQNRGEVSFENDALIEGGQLGQMHNGVTFREVRQYRSGHHLVRFYFLTRVYSTYLESILSDFQSGPQPDVLIANSCVWDVNRYHDPRLEDYKTNLDRLFLRLKEVLSPQCLIIWTMTMPVGYKETEIPMFHNIPQNLRMDMVVGNFFSATLAHFHKVDVLDMHYYFRCDLRLRWHDFVHWNYFAHRKYTQILLTHIARAWGVEGPTDPMPEDAVVHLMAPHFAAPVPELQPPIQEPERYNHGVPCPGNFTNRQLVNSEDAVVHLAAPHLAAPVPELLPPIQEPGRHSQGAAYAPGYASFDGSEIGAMLGAAYMPGYTSFDGSEIVAMLGVPGPGNFTNGQLMNSEAISPFVTDSPLLNVDMTPGYVRPLAGAWKMRPRKRLKPRGGWRRPYC